MTQLDTAALDHPQLDLAAAVLQSGAAIRLRALGSSMIPAVWPGDLLTIDPVSSSTVLAGEVVLCVRDQRFLIHRLMHAGTLCGASDWITRGDALLNPDPGVPAEAILGRVSQITRGRRTLVPKPPTAFARKFAWIFCRADLFCRLVLRIHSLRQGTWMQCGRPAEQAPFLPSQMAQR